MMRAGVALLAVALVAGAASAARADALPERAREIVEYDIRVSLDPATKQLTGHQRLTWRNPSNDTVPDLWFHLYLNAFKNSRSTFWRESGGELRGFAAEEDGWGWIDVTSLKLADGTDLTRALRFDAPDDGNRDDRTVARLVLPKPVGPGEAVTLDVAFKARLPHVFARTGYVRDYFLVGQWFPKLAVYEPAGRRGRATGAWNGHQFHANSEFYADFGRYRVEITVPSTFVLGATGERVARRDNRNGTTTYVHEQADIHDFAWTVDPRFVEIRRRFDPAREVPEREARAVADLLGRPIEEVRLSSVEVVLLMQPEHLRLAERHLQAVTLALKWFGLWYGRYPYRTLTIVDPAPGGLGSAGMEYPTFVTAGSHALVSYWPFTGVRLLPEEVTVHEVGHQFWQGLVATNEFEEAWLDEGINSYSTGQVMELGYGRDATLASLPGLRVGALDYIRLQNNPNRIFDSSRKPAWTFGPSSYEFNVYAKPELVLRTLKAHLGEQTLARAMRTYHERWRFGHPSSDDFYAVVSEVAGRDLRPLLVQLVETGALLDYEVGTVSSERQFAPEGYFDAPDGRRRSRAGDQPEASAPYETSVTVRRRGDVVLPVTIAFKFAGKPVERVTWDGQARWKRFTFTRPERLEWVDVDPDRKLVLDVDWLNNARRVEPDRRAAAWLTTRWWLVVQQLIGWVAL